MRFLFIFLIFPCILSAQEVFRFEPALTGDHGAFGLTLSPDSKTALWVRSKGKRDTLVILESRKVRGRWTSPQTASFSTSEGKWKDIDPMFSPDGDLVLFQSDKPVPGLPQRKGFDIWAVKKLKNGWSEPYHLGNALNSDDSESYASMSRSGDIYFMKENPDGLGKSDIYMAKKTRDGFPSPVNLGAPVNTSFRESNPFISPSGDYLIYFSSDTSGLGDVDLYITFRKGDTWQTPVSLGSPINTADAEFCPFYHEREKRLYFSRQRKTPSRLQENIYYIPLDIDKFRP